jgi:ABC-type microcin C transport system permease subunit YejB
LKRTMFVAIIGISFFVSQSIYGYDEERAIANLASDFADCTAYYIIAAEALRRSGKEVMAHEALEASDRAYIYAIQFSSRKVAAASVRLAFDKQRNEMHHDFLNFQILTLKYGEMCRDALESPEVRLEYWLKKKD